MDRFWGLLTPAEHAVLSTTGTERDYASGAVVCHEGEITSYVLVVRKGLLRVTATTAAGGEKVLAVRGAGDIVGERSAIDGLPRSATVRALGSVRALVLTAPGFASLCQRHPRIAWAVLTVIVARQRDADRQRVQISGTATQRVAAVLIDVALERGIADQGGVALSQEELAGIAGTSRESLVRVLRALREEGIISTGRRKIDILEVDRLYDLTM
ncbi:Crp/Fnr family transcriptional regulator [Actinosynnema sp. NPDC047251]|uniref:Transcriptional regulator, Crp/Fnr family n=1 Tax=Saccharothrix espanaensis (strain ATCC 51144 / DSM 44229 / JCM 9112 / NBRC 15066 / NRRL 15764) TaxID=1179773 RepID=K0K1S3_SACES|nr:Crp/Fnr family transcriptional regulator [Saccharothrix espanaensis]CCH34165.1 Transcriptional regulator, Crp/Fnr family [Saccharothrix espanaensis DSM 44229]